MPNLACRTCGRVVYATAPIEALFAEELRCPRCGAHMDAERRSARRRQRDRRERPIEDPGPPNDVERRVAERRQGIRRHDDRGSPGGA